MRGSLALFLPFAACAHRTPAARAPGPPAPLGVSENLDEATRHEAEAAALERQASERAGATASPDAGCGDPVLADQVTSGGVRVSLVAPCWRPGSVVDPKLREAGALRADAEAHRTQAAQLVEAEREACAAFAEDELDDSAFLVPDLLSVVASIEDGRIRGARIRFRPVEGLSADWLRASIKCQQARGAALGWDPRHASFDPTVLPGANAWVTVEPDAIQVEITADDPATALIVYHRAESLLAPED